MCMGVMPAPCPRVGASGEPAKQRLEPIRAEQVVQADASLQASVQICKGCCRPEQGLRDDALGGEAHNHV